MNVGVSEEQSLTGSRFRHQQRFISYRLQGMAVAESHVDTHLALGPEANVKVPKVDLIVGKTSIFLNSVVCCSEL